MILRVLLLTVILCVAPTATSRSDDVPEKGNPSERGGVIGDWPLDTVSTKNGRQYRGYIQSTSDEEIDFVEVVRPPQRDMYLVVRPIRLSEVASLRRLPDQEQRVLAERIERFRHRFHIEAGALEAVELNQFPEDGRNQFVYQGDWFTLRSTSDEETTRYAVVRIEQIFRAYRHVMPPRVKPKQQLTIQLYGTISEYQKYLTEKQLGIDHPAFYSAASNLIVAGANVAVFSEDLRKIRESIQLQRQHLAERHANFLQQQKQYAAQLEQIGLKPDEVNVELLVRKKAWENEFQSHLRKLNDADRRNDAKFAEVKRQLFARLAHEAFHAYVENFLYPQRVYQFPRWLNEGMAQVFETGRLDGETLRIDAPDRELLRSLQMDLAVAPLPLAELITADEVLFLAGHASSTGSQRRYLYSWGLAWHLFTNHRIADQETFDDFVAKDAERNDPIIRFERFVKAPVPVFEQEWRKAMLAEASPPP